MFFGQPKVKKEGIVVDSPKAKRQGGSTTPKAKSTVKMMKPFHLPYRPANITTECVVIIYLYIYINFFWTESLSVAMYFERDS